MRNLLLIGILFLSQNLFSQKDLIVSINDVKIGMSQEETLKITGEPSEKFELTADHSNYAVEIWMYKDDSDAIVHSVEFTDSKVSRVVPDYEQYQQEILKQTEIHSK